MVLSRFRSKLRNIEAKDIKATPDGDKNALSNETSMLQASESLTRAKLPAQIKNNITRQVISEFLVLPERKSSDLETLKNSHFTLHIEETEKTFLVYSVTSSKNRIPSKIYNRPKSLKKKCWPTQISYADESVLIYNISIPKHELTPNARFFIEKNKTWIRILPPFHSSITLPKGWSFSQHHLYLTYQSSEAQKETRQRAFVRSITSNEHGLILEGVLITSHETKEGSITIRKFRDGNASWEFPITLMSAHRVWGRVASSYTSYRGEYAYKFKCAISLPWQDLVSSIYTAIVHIGHRSTGLFPFNKTFASKNGLFELDQRTIHTYIDVVANNLRIDIYDFNKAHALEQINEANATLQNRSVPICLVGEYTNAARDNGLRLFESTKKSPKIEYWYVGEEGCGVSGINFTRFGSKEHFALSLKASCVAFTHHPNYVLPILPWSSRARTQPKTLFLQHGVTALKNSMPSYHSGKRLFDAFAVCSERERSSVIEACAYPADRVHIIGMSRLDNLMEMSQRVKVDRQDVIIFPTWRRGLDKIHGDDFVHTDFYINWSNALQQIKKSCEKNGKRAVLISHPIIGHHVDYFKDSVDAIIEVENIQEALCQAYMLFTDYSSICFDAVYIDVPVVFFTFDEEEYGFQNGAFIDIESELPGVHCRTIEELQDKLLDLNAFCEDARKEAHSKMSIYFENIDNRNCERTENLIVALSKESLEEAQHISAVPTIIQIT